MSFLSEHDALPADDAAARTGHLIRWLRTDWRGLYADLRANRPVFAAPPFTMVTRATDVLDVLAQPSLYSVRANRASMDPSVGPFMLARDETEINWRERGLMQACLRFDDLPRVRALAGETAQAALACAAGSIDVVSAIGRAVPLRIVQRHFGFAAPDADMLRWSFATQHAMFRDLAGTPEVVAACIAAGEEMRAWLWPFLAGKWAGPDGGDTVVDRLVALSRLAEAATPPERVVSNVCGLLVGAIETTSQAIAQALDQLLARPDQLARAREAALAQDTQTFDRIVFEALRFDPITTIQFRIAEADRVIGEGTDYATPVRAGTRLAVCTGSAMFDPDLMPDPERFSIERPPSSYLHFGMGHHECLGKHVGLVSIPEAVRRLVLLPDLRRAEGAAGRIDFAGGPFPEHFTVLWG